MFIVIHYRDPEALPASNYLVIQTPGDPNYGGGPNSSQLTSPSGQAPPFGPSGGAGAPPGGRGASNNSGAVVSLILFN